MPFKAAQGLFSLDSFSLIGFGGLLFGDDVSLPSIILGADNLWPKTFDRTSWYDDPLGLRMKRSLTVERKSFLP